jgi:hypothetical protein
MLLVAIDANHPALAVPTDLMATDRARVKMTPMASAPVPIAPTASAVDIAPQPDPSQPRPQDYRSVDPPIPVIFPGEFSLDFRTSTGSDDKLKRIVEPSAQFYLANGDEIRLTTGFNFFQQSGLDAVNNYPLRLAWKGKAGMTVFHAMAGVDVFDRLPAVPTASVRLDQPLGTTFDRQGRLSAGVILSTSVEYGAYKFSAKSLENRVAATQIKPSIYWQMGPDTKLYAHYQAGLLNDGNLEQQVFARVQQQLGPELFVAANLFSWSFSQDQESRHGYFSPPDFLTYTGEVGWEGNVVPDRLKCRLSAAFGRQRNQGNFAGANTYNASCDAQLSADLSLELGYSRSNIRDRTTSTNDFNTQEFSGRLKYRFD